MKDIKNIIFDFGGVLYDINIEKARENFRKTGVESRPWQRGQDEIFDLMETGKISPAEILLFFKKISTRNPQPTDGEIWHAFNSVLIQIDLQAVAWLRKLKQNFNLYLLSNTNEIHYRKFSNEIKSNPDSADFYDCFIRQYYSFQLGLRKPDPAIFQFVLQDAAIKTGETLFVDDSPDNTRAAENLGFRVFTFNGENPWERLTSNLNYDEV